MSEDLNKIIELFKSNDISNKKIASQILSSNPDIYESVPTSEIVRFYTEITGITLNEDSPRVKSGEFTLEKLFRLDEMDRRRYYMLSWMGYYTEYYDTRTN